MPQNPEQGKRSLENPILATAELSKRISDKMSQQFPLIENESGLAAYHSRKYWHASVRADAPPRLLIPVLNTAFGRAMAAETPTYSEHGAEHVVFTEALKAAQSFLEINQLDVRAVPYTVQLDGHTGQIRQIERFILETPRFEHTTGKPFPQSEAEKAVGDERTITRMARKYASDPEFGYAFALLFLCYKGMDPETIKSTLVNNSWLKQANIPGFVLREGKTDSAKAITALRNLVMIQTSSREWVPNLDSAQFFKAIDFLKTKVRIDVSNTKALRFTEAKQYPYARVVISGAVEQAEHIAPSEFRDPARHQFIHRLYENTLTTQVITAFLKFD